MRMGRRRVSYDNLINILSNKFKNTSINLVILSDGVRKRDKSYLNNLCKEKKRNYFFLYNLEKGQIIKKDSCIINIMDIVIGGGKEKDFLAMKYIYYADYMIEPFSSFPIVLAELLNKATIGGDKKGPKEKFYIRIPKGS